MTERLGVLIELVTEAVRPASREIPMVTHLTRWCSTAFPVVNVVPEQAQEALPTQVQVADCSSGTDDSDEHLKFTRGTTMMGVRWKGAVRLWAHQRCESG